MLGVPTENQHHRRAWSYDLAYHNTQSYCKLPQTAVPKKYSGLLFEKKVYICNSYCLVAAWSKDQSRAVRVVASD